jgi:hypothetical protein
MKDFQARFRTAQTQGGNNKGADNFPEGSYLLTYKGLRTGQKESDKGDYTYWALDWVVAEAEDKDRVGADLDLFLVDYRDMDLRTLGAIARTLSGDGEVMEYDQVLEVLNSPDAAGVQVEATIYQHKNGRKYVRIGDCVS